MQPNQPIQNPNDPFAQVPITPSYDFITNPEVSRKRALYIPGGSMISRLIVGLLGLVVLIIVFVLAKGLLSTSPFSKADYIAVAQNQNSIIHILSTDVSSNQEQSVLTIDNQNFAVTVQLAISSAQTQILTYLKDNKVKYKPTELNLKINTSVDTQLANSLATNSFNQEFDQVMQQQLQSYEQSLITAYKTSHGAKGKALLKSEYSGAQLLLKQLSLPTS